ncbi:hypothetical protein LSH36_270g03065 [Paralvinella palmiformis]|uniref:Uncharacterized protein n=1 Tax=Paralvinella palmiformis TaxID=53620 RepID=A0AAD9JKJ3_9ANNE|nr:hypothetical protein LSH36_270g03065 [Paralvinella palmiformis]
MGGKQSTGTPPRMRTYSHAGDGMPMSSNGAAPGALAVGGAGGSGVSARGRTRSLGSVQQNGSHPGHLSIPSSNGGPHGSGASPDSDTSTPEEGPLNSLPRGFIQASSLPVQLFPFQGNQCNLPYDRRYLVMGFAVMDEVG